MAIRKDDRTDREKAAAAVGLTVAQLDAAERRVREQADSEKAKKGARAWLRDHG